MDQPAPIPDAISAHLSAGEQVLWFGQPLQGLRFGSTGANGETIQSTILILTIWVVLWELRNAKGSYWWLLLGLAVMLTMIVLVVAPVFDARRRARIHYALTSERVMVAGGSGRDSVQSISLLTLPGLSLIEGKDERGTVWLGFKSWPGTGNDAPLQLNMIADARHVYQMIRDAQKCVWEQHLSVPLGGQPESTEVVQADRIPTAIGANLSAGEQVLWLGRPRRGLMLRAEDTLWRPVILLLAFLIGVLCLLWVYQLTVGKGMAHAKGTGFWRMNVLFVSVVLLVLFMHARGFFADAWQRARIHYALTSERVLIARGSGRGSIQSVNLHTLSDLSLTEGSDGYGTVGLAPIPPSKVSGDVFGVNMPPQLDTIPDAQRVYQLIRDAQPRV